MSDENRMKVKICLVGEGAVGKTSLIRRYVLDEFDDRYISTLGTKVSKKEIIVEGSNGREPLTVDLTIWDIMGEKGFRDLLREAYFHGAQAVLAVCDLTRKGTLDELENWIDAVERVTGKVNLIILGNKIDLTDELAVNEKELAKAGAKFNAPYYFTSARTGANVERSFAALASTLAEEYWNA